MSSSLHAAHETISTHDLSADSVANDEVLTERIKFVHTQLLFIRTLQALLHFQIET